jgi:lipoyl(octanoyl) transferase
MTSSASTKNAVQTAGRVVWLGDSVDYQDAWDVQRRTASRRAADEITDTLLLLEHAAVYTAGPRAPEAHIHAELPAPLVQTDRGGQVTYHGPGQLVGYPIIGLVAKGFGPKAYVAALETAIVDALAVHGVDAHIETGVGLTGVWTDQGKIAAIGVKISRGVTLHGFALNVNTDLAAYAPIVPCGIADRPVTSMASVLAANQDLRTVSRNVADALGARLSIAWAEMPAADLG